MKKLLLTIATLSFISFGASAWACDGHKNDKHNRGMGKILKDSELALTAEQVASIQEIRSSYKTQWDAAKANKTQVKISDLDESAADYQEQVDAIKAERAERRAARKIEKEAMHAEVTALLSPTQQTRLETLVAEMKTKQGKKRSGKDKNNS